MKYISLFLIFVKLNWTAIIATLAFIVSFATLYYSFWENFNLKLYVTGRFEIQYLDKKKENVAISLPINFTNSGATAGVINNLFLIIKNGERTLYYFPNLEITSLQINTSGERIPLKALAFNPFSIKVRESINKKILFLPHEKSADKILSAGNYTVEVYAQTHSDKWKKYDSIAIEIDEEDISAIGNFEFVEGEMTMFPSRNKYTDEIKNGFSEMLPK
jgi:hypothetical protein